MAQHAFAGMPAQALYLSGTHPEIVSEGLFGVGQGWDVPFAVWRARAGFDVSYGSNDHVTLSFVMRGAAIERLDGRFRGRGGGADPDGFILYPGGGSRHYAGRGDTRICQMYLQPSLIALVAGGDRQPAPAAVELRDDRIFARDRELRALADQYVVRAMSTAAPPSTLEMDSRAVLLVLSMLRRHSSLASMPAPPRGGLSPYRLRSVLEFVEGHLAEPLALADLAQVAGLTPRHLCTAFQRSVGQPPHRYLTLRRVERAKRLLAGEIAIAEVALACGFCSQQHLTSVFKRTTGTTPAAWRSSLLD